MSVRQMGAVWDLDLDPKLKLTLLALADKADHEGHNAYPSVNYLAHHTGHHRRTIQRHLAELKQLGLIEETLRGGREWILPDGRRGRSTNYTLTLHMGDRLPPYDGGRTPPIRVTPAPPTRRQNATLMGDTHVTQSIKEPSFNRDGDQAPHLEPPNPDVLEKAPDWLRSKVNDAYKRTTKEQT